MERQACGEGGQGKGEEQKKCSDIRFCGGADEKALSFLKKNVRKLALEVSGKNNNENRIVRLPLAGRPTVRATAQKMQVKMEDPSSGAAAVIENGAIPWEQIASCSEFSCNELQFTKHRLIFRGGIVQRGKMLSRGYI